MKKMLPYLLATLIVLTQERLFAQQFSVEPVVSSSAIDGTSRIYITPNPVHGSSYFYLQIDSCTGGNTDKLVIYTSSGYIIQSKELITQTGQNRFLITMSGFMSGYYVLRIVGKDVPAFSFSTQFLVDM